MIEEFKISNELLSATIKRKGAELCSVRNTRSGYEFIWQAGDVWPRHAPNLFPIVGSLLDHEYIYQGKNYSLSHHGFARDLNFDLLHQSEHSAAFVLRSNEATLAKYPFKFTLLITYTLNGDTLEQRFRVINEGDKIMPVSFGGHPAFNADPIQDHYIEFSEEEDVKSNHLTVPYIDDQMFDVINKDKIDLDTSTFNEDALIFEGLKSEYVSLKSKYNKREVKVRIKEFPYLGIWSKPAAPYVCIEPWQGLADLLSHNKELIDKKGMFLLAPQKQLTKSFTMQFIDK